MGPSDWITLCQWDAACRSLMLLHPWFGLTQSGLALGTGDSAMRPGWNRVVRDELSQDPVVFTFIGNNEGQTTTAQPTSDVGPIRDATQPPPDLQGSELWLIVRTLGQGLAQSNLRSTSEIQRVETSIETASRQMREQDRMRELWREAMTGMHQALRDCRGGQIRNWDFQKPVFDLIEAYLSFDITGMLASEVLGVLLSTQCTIPILGPPEIMSGKARMAALEHLADTAYDLLSRRSLMSVPAYFEATYLAGLYCRAAFRIASWAKPSGTHTKEELNRIAKLCLNVDELFAHKVGPTFVLPGLFKPRRLLAWIEETARRTGQTVAELAEFYQLHPGLRALIEPQQIWLKMSDAEVTEAYKRNSDECSTFDIQAALKQSAAPVAPENLEKILIDILKTGLGGAALPPDAQRQL